MGLVLFFYVADIVVSINDVMLFILLMLFVFAIISSINVALEDNRCAKEELKPANKVAWGRVVKCGLPLAIATALLPSKNTMYLMAGAYGVTEVAKNERVQSLASNSLTYIERELAKALAENGGE